MSVTYELSIPDGNSRCRRVPLAIPVFAEDSLYWGIIIHYGRKEGRVRHDEKPLKKRNESLQGEQDER